MHGLGCCPLHWTLPWLGGVSGSLTGWGDPPGGNRSAGGNATAVGRLVNAVDWLVDAEPGLYDALDVPLRPAAGRLGPAAR